MNIAVIAANGRSGRVFVEQALAAGHSVRAGIHRSDPFAAQPGLTVMRCDAGKAEDIANLLAGAGAVVSFIGHRRGSAPDVQTTATRLACKVMHTAGQRRIVSLTGTGVRLPGDSIRLIDRVANIAIKLIDPKRIADGIEHTAVLQASGLDWTIIRVMKLQNTPARPYRLREHGPGKLVVSRREVASAVLDVLEHESFVGAAPIIGPA